MGILDVYDVMISYILLSLLNASSFFGGGEHACIVFRRQNAERSFVFQALRGLKSLDSRKTNDLETPGINNNLLTISRVKKLFKSNQTGHGVPRVQNKKNFCYSLSRKKVSFSYGNLRLLPIFNFEISIFHRAKELFKSNKTRCGVSHGCLKSKTERIFGIACLGKKLVFHTEICYYFE